MVVINIGPHYHDMPLYENDVDYVVETFKALKKRGPSDLNFFRTTVPGHYGCEPPNPKNATLLRDGQREIPYRSHEEYAQHGATIRRDPSTWRLFEAYNAYVRRQVGDVFAVLDVFNMTVNRRNSSSSCHNDNRGILGDSVIWLSAKAIMSSFVFLRWQILREAATEAGLWHYYYY